MNISDFISTVVFTLFIGIIIGYLFRDFSSGLKQFYHRRIQRPIYFEEHTKKTKLSNNNECKS
jgi:ACR3 family arsenite efflux pump ArsB